MRQDRRRICLKTVCQEQRDTVWRSHLDHLMDHALRHSERAWTDIESQEQLPLRVDGRPDPMG